MYFYSNPFDDFKFTGMTQQDLKFEMACEAFDYIDSERGNAKMVGVHYYLKEEVVLRGSGMSNILDEELYNMFFVNRTELNNQ